MACRIPGVASALQSFTGPRNRPSAAARAPLDCSAMKVIEHLKLLDDARFLSMYEALSKQGFGPLDVQVAADLRFRPQAIRKLPMEKRAKRARALLLAKGKAELCYEFFGAYLLEKRR